MKDNKNEQPINLKNPILAAFLTWIIPGWGHYYQGRTAKAVLFFLCIVPMFLVGCFLGSSSKTGIARNVYCSFRSQDLRIFFLPQAFLGTAAVPAGIQAWQLKNRQIPILGSFMAPGQIERGDSTGVAPTIRDIQRALPFFELGTYLIAIAGLMNLLVIFDALDGPHILREKEKPKEKNEETQA
ncbi:hypothetical protein FACS189454_00590 [Planctomycetales bacterium]|nr:hypothetical protein FACS189454_00590 [Planctomycetales bacterium]